MNEREILRGLIAKFEPTDSFLREFHQEPKVNDTQPHCMPAQGILSVSHPQKPEFRSLAPVKRGLKLKIVPLTERGDLKYMDSIFYAEGSSHQRFGSSHPPMQTR